MAGALVVAILATLGMVVMIDPIGEIVAPPASSGAVHNAALASPAEQAYLEGLDPYLDVVIGEGKRLTELGQARSRNVLELGVRMDRFREASADVQAFFEEHKPPPGLQAMVGKLSLQLASAESAIQASISAIRAFDWDALGKSVDDFSRAIEAITLLRSSRSE